MSEFEYRDVKRPEMLKDSPLEDDDLTAIGRDQGASIGTDLDGNTWPTQLWLYYDHAREKTIVLPKGPNNRMVPFRLEGIIKPKDVYDFFHAKKLPAPQEGEAPLEGEASEVHGSTVDPVADAIDADDDDEGEL